MKLSTTLFLILVIGMVGHARHIHSRHFSKNFEHHPDKEMILADEIPYVFQLTRIKQNNLVPVNNVLFFKTYDPCPDDMKRDILGICREVWND